MKIDFSGSAERLRAGDWLLQTRETLMARHPLAFDNIEQGSGDRAILLQEASIEAQALLAHVLQRPRAWLLAHPETTLSAAQLDQLAGLLRQLLDGAPLPYLTGRKAFFGLEFEVSPAVLIPRPETELLVEQAIDWLKMNPGRLRAAEAGVGSGCIAISLAKYVPRLCLLAVDRSWPALQIAQRNCLRHSVTERVALYQGDLLFATAGSFDLVCANLPYIPSGTLAGLSVARYEPGIALNGGTDGLREIAALIADSPRWLAPAGLLLLEIQYNQGEQVANLARAALPGAQVDVLPDLAGLPRLVRIENA